MPCNLASNPKLNFKPSQRMHIKYYSYARLHFNKLGNKKEKKKKRSFHVTWLAIWSACKARLQFMLYKGEGGAGLGVAGVVPSTKLPGRHAQLCSALVLLATSLIKSTIGLLTFLFFHFHFSFYCQHKIVISCTIFVQFLIWDNNKKMHIHICI